MTLQRLTIVRNLFLVLGVVIVSRLFYWQVLASEALSKIAQTQHFSQDNIPAKRGEIYTSDDFPLVQNQDSFTAYAYLPDLALPPDKLIDLLEPIIPQATQAAFNPQASWVSLAKRIPRPVKSAIDSLNLSGIGFDLTPVRSYPESSLSAHLLGFVGQNNQGEPQGYFGLEGFYDLELRGRPGKRIMEKDATGKPIPAGVLDGFPAQDGRNLKLHLNRSIQLMVETKLAHALDKYGAISGEVAIMDPHTGGIIALASLPKYDPAQYTQFDPALYKNPLIANTYEPGSTFKVLVMAAALNEGLVSADTRCDDCSQPLTIGKYTIRTWNDEYRPNLSMTDVIVHSDNIGMVFVGQQLGKDNLVKYLDSFGIGQPTDIDLQEETSPKLALKQKWGDIDLATASFGQGIAVTGIQMLTAVSAIANQGQLMKPHIVDQVVGDKAITIAPKIIRRVISSKTAQQITDMMVAAVDQGEAQWTKLKGYKIAGKTGTAQIPVAGHYDEEKTVASFVGFAPADNPKFVMLVKLREPQSSPWAAETAAPLWFSIAKDLLLYYNIPPQN